VYCPSNGTLPCRIVEGYSQSNCSSGIACEFPDGTVEFGLSAEECRYGKRERDFSSSFEVSFDNFCLD